MKEGVEKQFSVGVGVAMAGSLCMKILEVHKYYVIGMQHARCIITKNEASKVLGIRQSKSGIRQ